MTPYRSVFRGVFRPVFRSAYRWGGSGTIISAPDGVYPGNDLFVTGGCASRIYQLYIDGVPYGDVFTVSPTEIPFVTTGQKITVLDSCGNVSNELTAEGLDLALRLQNHRGRIVGYLQGFTISGVTDYPELNGDYLPDGMNGGHPRYWKVGDRDSFAYWGDAGAGNGYGLCRPGYVLYALPDSVSSDPPISDQWSGFSPDVISTPFQSPIYEPLGLYQDTACTIPALLDGDPIGAWRDEITGNALVFAQADSMRRPVLRFVNGVPCVETDGIDDLLTTTGMPTGFTDVSQWLTARVIRAGSGVQEYLTTGGDVNLDCLVNGFDDNPNVRFWNNPPAVVCGAADVSGYHCYAGTRSNSNLIIRGYIDGVLGEEAAASTAPSLANWALGSADPSTPPKMLVTSWVVAMHEADAAEVALVSDHLNSLTPPTS